ncbi:MAG: enoyl-CoA hydratase [Cytophagia bacterium]|nr:MAG: enoyl-CoA hydratase [Cytophagales bacterium]TAG01445.1 MAG: enoyl-CoA hydratase [Cytophagia bacterium]TAH29695.1 MAG: enoyl-CoA hydratase [Cytophagales bacterium]
MYYSNQETQNFFNHTFAYLELKVENHFLHLFLNRPKAKNALSPTLIRELAFALSYAHHENEIWGVVLGARGDVWCAGMDLKAMKGQEEMNDSTIPTTEKEIILGEMFVKLHKPAIVRVHAPVYAGGFLLVGSAHYAVGTLEASFGLPEVKRGLFPFQVMSLLLQNIPTRIVIDWCLKGKKLSALEAKNIGLISDLVDSEMEIDEFINKNLIEPLIENSPSAIHLGLKAFDEMRAIDNQDKQAFLKKMFEECIQTQDAQEGIKAFAEKRKPIWENN